MLSFTLLCEMPPYFHVVSFFFFNKELILEEDTEHVKLYSLAFYQLANIKLFM